MLDLLARVRAALTPNRVALLTAGLLDVAALCSALAGVIPGSAARAIVTLGACASAAAKGITFAIGSWKHAQLQADTGDAEADAISPADLPSDQEELDGAGGAPPLSGVNLTEPAPAVEAPPREGPPVQPSQAGFTQPPEPAT